MFNENIDIPLYRKIALDLANRICNGEFKEGERIHGRSTLSGEYKVSPETIRRAVILLEDMHVVTAMHGSGIFIKSRKKALEFIELFQKNETISSLRLDITSLINQKKQIENQINDLINRIIDYSARLKNINPLQPMEFNIAPNCPLIGSTVLETKFWQNTGGTIVAIRRNDKLIVSPGPYVGFEAGDTILVVGDTGIIERVKAFMEKEKA